MSKAFVLTVPFTFAFSLTLAQSLSPFILARIQQKYTGKKVFGITEVSSDAGLNYYIILEDDKKWYHVTSDATGNLSLEDKYNKA